MPNPAAIGSHLASTVAECGTDARLVWSHLGTGGFIRGLYRPSSDGRCVPESARLGALLTELDLLLPLGTVLSVCVQVATVIPLLAEARTENRLARKLADSALCGESIIALAVTDAGAPGSELLDACTDVTISESGLTLRGGKDWITNAMQCDHMLVLARHSAARHFTSFSWVLVPAATDGVSVRSASSTLFTGSGVGHVRFDEVRLDRDHLVGRRGRALAAFARHVGTERLAGALWAQGLCRRVLAETRLWLATSTASGRTRWENPAVRQRFGRCLVELHRLDALCAMHRDGPVSAPAAGEGMALKAAVGASVEQILGECADLRGANAFRDGGEASLRAEAAMFGIAGGATGAMLTGIADDADTLLGIPR